VTEPSDFAFEIATDKLKRHKSAGTDPIPAKMTKAERRTIRTEIHTFVNSV
jgi:hypothetical protein